MELLMEGDAYGSPEGEHIRLKELMSFEEIMSDRSSVRPSEEDHIRSKELISFRRRSCRIEGAYVLRKEIMSDRRSLRPSE
ncbi:hypothetical protein L1987_02195 [Smallanthus sonchifolius]|uniref:Uncharacterized protein n=1 Tax=Smallanthus sonchifolius TaxID=185202 RepID=A0ACB9K798_9ASTR|nr:hypothetical protein L1987_02195 [Smallanthus sonchifolius]